MSLRSMIQDFAHELDDEDNASSDLWTWLPSHFAAEKSHGDYASEQQPSRAYIMAEAANVIAYLARGSDIERSFKCPCGECDVVSTLQEWKEKIGVK